MTEHLNESNFDAAMHESSKTRLRSCQSSSFGVSSPDPFIYSLISCWATAPKKKGETCGVKSTGGGLVSYWIIPLRSRILVALGASPVHALKIETNKNRPNSTRMMSRTTSDEMWTSPSEAIRARELAICFVTKSAAATRPATMAP